MSCFDILDQVFEEINKSTIKDNKNNDINCNKKECGGLLSIYDNKYLICENCNCLFEKTYFKNDYLETFKLCEDIVSSNKIYTRSLQGNTKRKRIMNTIHNSNMISNDEKNVIKYKNEFKRLFGSILSPNLIDIMINILNFMVKNNKSGNFKINNIEIMCRIFINFLIDDFNIFYLDKYLIELLLPTLTKKNITIYNKNKNFFNNIDIYLKRNKEINYKEVKEHFKTLLGEFTIEQQLSSLCEKYSNYYKLPKNSKNEIFNILSCNGIENIIEDFNKIHYKIISIITFNLNYKIKTKITKTTLINYSINI